MRRGLEAEMSSTGWKKQVELTMWWGAGEVWRVSRKEKYEQREIEFLRKLAEEEEVICLLNCL